MKKDKKSVTLEELEAAGITWGELEALGITWGELEDGTARRKLEKLKEHPLGKEGAQCGD